MHSVGELVLSDFFILLVVILMKNKVRGTNALAYFVSPQATKKKTTFYNIVTSWTIWPNSTAWPRTFSRSFFPNIYEQKLSFDLMP
jgi:hypothetical protein